MSPLRSCSKGRAFVLEVAEFRFCKLVAIEQRVVEGEGAIDDREDLCERDVFGEVTARGEIGVSHHMKVCVGDRVVGVEDCVADLGQVNVLECRVDVWHAGFGRVLVDAFDLLAGAGLDSLFCAALFGFDHLYQIREWCECPLFAAPHPQEVDEKFVEEVHFGEVAVRQEGEARSGAIRVLEVVQGEVPTGEDGEVINEGR